MTDLDQYRYQMVCRTCGTRGELTPYPDRAENQTQRHNRIKHGSVAAADVEATTVADH